jgi:hypothetical protein
MKKFAVSVLATLAIAAQPALVTRTLSKDIAPHIETIPIQTLTISDEQFLKRDASGRATTISGIKQRDVHSRYLHSGGDRVFTRTGV